jgi:glycosyltransferase involved in cell wall biosynthesis
MGQRKLRIAYLIDHMGPGGAQEILLSLIENRSPGIEAKVYSLRDRTLPTVAARLARAEVSHRTLGLTGPALLAPMRLRRWLTSDAPDLLHTFLDVSNSLGPACVATMTRPRPHVIRHIDNDPYRHYRWITRRGLPLLRPWVTAHIAVSPALAVASHRLFRSASIEVVPPGIDLQRFGEGGGRSEALPAAQPAQEGVATIGTVARLTDQKGLDRLIEAIAPIRARWPGLRVLIAGDGPRRAALEAQADRLGLTPVVSFLGHIADVRPVYRALDVFVLPSRHEGSPLALVEAMAMGVPVVATRVVGSADLVRDGSTGVLVESERSQALAEAVIRLLADPARRASLAREARRWVRAERSAASMARKIEAIYAVIVRP